MEESNYHKSGVAAIKTEFLLQDHVRELNLNFVAVKDKKKLVSDCSKESPDEPPAKKLKGQNKHRPRGKRAPRSEKLCFKIGTEGTCPFGDSCCYSHDVKSYLENKPPDIGRNCYLYRTYGKCSYTFSCRFASDHIQDGKNIIMDEKWNLFKNKQLFSNILTKDLQSSLRRRTYDFKQSDNVRANKEKCRNDSNVKPVVENKGSDCDVSQKLPSGKTTDDVSDNLYNGSEIKCKTDNDLKPVIKKGSDCDISEELSADKATNDMSLEKSLPEALTNENTETGSINKGDLKPEFPVISPPEVLHDNFFLPEVKKINFKDKLYLAPLTTVGNLPFRRICKELGADITCSEMSMALSLLQGQQSEWALIKRHHTEDIFGIQLCGYQPEVMTRCCQLLSENTSFDFIDLNLGCPLDGIYRKGGGCGLMNRTKKLKSILDGVSSVIDVPLTLKMRTGIYGHEKLADNLIRKLKEWRSPVSLITLHGRSREQRYTKSADWDYIDACNKIAEPILLFGNGDILSYEDYNLRRAETGISGVMIARGALIKPWIFKEIKDQVHWDISSSERFDILQKYSNYGLEHWGSDTEGVEKTRRFMLEWLSFLYRYIPVGLLERPPQRINERPPAYFGRNDLETLMASPSCSDWIKISEMLLGPVPDNFIFLPKHKANAYN